MVWLRRLGGWFDRRRRTVLGALGLWIVVASASAGTASDDSSSIAVPDLSWVLVGAFALLIPVGLFLAYLLLGGERDEDETAPARRPNRWVAALVLVAVVLGLRLLTDREGDTHDDEPPQSAIETPELAENPSGLGGSADDDPIGRFDIAVAAAVGFAATGAVWWLRRETAVEPPPPSLIGSIAPALHQAIADLERTDDPRRAVLLAYASLERASADRGLSREPNETAAEHLRRTLGSLPVNQDELVELGQLYEQARFSTDPIRTTDRDRARAILERARDDIARTPSDRAGARR